MSVIAKINQFDDGDVTIRLPAVVANSPIVQMAIEVARAQETARVADEKASKALELVETVSGHVKALHDIHTNRDGEVNWLLYLTRAKDARLPDVRNIQQTVGADIKRFSVKLGYEPDPKRSNWLNGKPFHVYPTWILDRWFDEGGHRFFRR